MDKETLYSELASMKEEMKPGERMMGYVMGQEVDCQPYSFLAPDDALANIWGYTRNQVLGDFDLKCELVKRRKEEYGIDTISMTMGLRGIGEALGSTIVYPENSVDYVSHHVLTDYDMIEQLEQIDVCKTPKLIGMVEEAKRYQELFPDMVVSSDSSGPISCAAAIRPIEHILRDMRNNPEGLHRLLQLCVDKSLDWVRFFHKETGSRNIGMADPVTTTDILGRKYFLEYSKPYLEKLINGIEEITGSKPGVHICGTTKPIWGDLMDMGVKAFSIDNCESIAEAKEVMGQQVFLSGNVSPVDVMRNGTIDDVINAVIKCLDDGSDNPCGHLLSTGCQIPIGTPKENFDAYVYAVRKYGQGARIGCKPKGLELVK